MSYSIFRFTLNMHNHRSQSTVKVFKGDTAVKLIISLTDGGNIYKIVRGCTATLTGTKPNGEKLKHSCSIEGDTIIYIFDNETADQAGLATCEITLYDENGRVITAPKFTIDVAEKEVEGTDPISEYSSEAIATVMGAAAGEYARQQNELARQANEEQRQESYNRAETVANEAKAISQKFSTLDQKTVRAMELANNAGKNGAELLKKFESVELYYNKANGYLIYSYDNNGERVEKSVDLPLESSVIGIEEIEKNGKPYLRLTLSSGGTSDIELDDIFQGFVKNSSTAKTLYGVDDNGAQRQYPIISSDADELSETNWNSIIASKEYVKSKNKVYLDSIANATSGWYTLAKREGPGSSWCGSIFRVSCYVWKGTNEGSGAASTLFSVDMIETKSTPVISVQSYSCSSKNRKYIDSVRVVRNTTTQETYLQVHLNPPEGSSKTQFRTETLLHDVNRHWQVVTPVQSGSTVGYAVTEKSLVEYSWSDVTLPTSYINALPDKLTSLELNLESKLDALESKIDELSVREWFELCYYDIDDLDRRFLIFNNARKFSLYIRPYVSGIDSKIYLELVPDEQPSAGRCSCRVVSVEVYDSNNEICESNFEGGFAELGIYSDCNGENGYSTVYMTTDLTIYTADGDILLSQQAQYYEYSEEDGYSEGEIESCQAYVEKNKDTASLFPATYDLRARSIKNRLKASLEEAIAKHIADSNAEE